MERWQGLPPEVKTQYAVIHTVKRTAEKELVLLQDRESGARVLLRNYPGEPSAAYRLLLKKSLPHIPEIYAVEQRAGGFYVLEEFIEGSTLGKESLPLPDVLAILKQVCEALAALHTLGIVHRDVKPDNLLQTPSGGIYLLDLDAARQYKSHVEKDTCTLGTTGFAAPEQFGIVQTDHRADIFALGVTLNVLATGCHPSQSLCRGPLRRIILKCTRIDPRTRYQTARAVWRAAAPVYRAMRLRETLPSGRRLHIAGLCACAALLCAVCVYFVQDSLRPGALPAVAESSSSASGSHFLSASALSAVSSVPDAADGSESGSLSGSRSDSHSVSESDLSGSVSSGASSDTSSQSASFSRPSSSFANAGAGQNAGATAPVTPQPVPPPATTSSGTSSSVPHSSSSSHSVSAPASSSSAPASSSSSSAPPSSSSPSSSSSSAPSSSSSSKPSAQEEEIRAAIADYNALYSEYTRIKTLHQESYERYQALYGYTLSEIAARRDLAMHEASVAQANAAEAQARADAYGAEDPPNLEAQAQAQAEADSYTQLAAQKNAEASAADAEWAAMSARPEVQQARQEFSDYAVQGNALSGQVSAARDRVNYLQKLYGIYLM